METKSATAIAHPNIAFIKYWGNRDDALRIPMNDSLSMNLDALSTTTSVEFHPRLQADDLVIDGEQAAPQAAQRVSDFLDIIRSRMPEKNKAIIVSHNNFPMGAGIASSASAFAALAAAASQAAGLPMDIAALSRLARRGSGSACRSVPDGFVEWQAGSSDQDSFAFSIAPADHWRLVDLIVVVSRTHKDVGSSIGHALAVTSPLQKARLSDCPRRLQLCRQAILKKDFTTFASVLELDSNLMHAVMLTSTPALLYWEPATIAIMKKVRAWRAQGLPACYTIDAGPNVHVLCPAENAAEAEGLLKSVNGVEALYSSSPGNGVRLV